MKDMVLRYLLLFKVPVSNPKNILIQKKIDKKKRSHERL